MDDLMNSLMYEGTKNLNLINEIHTSLLNILLNKNMKNNENWKDALEKYISTIKNHEENYLEEDQLNNNNDDDNNEIINNLKLILNKLKKNIYNKLKIEDKLFILVFLCENVIDSDHFRSHIDKILEIQYEIKKETREIQLIKKNLEITNENENNKKEKIKKKKVIS